MHEKNMAKNKLKSNHSRYNVIKIRIKAKGVFDPIFHLCAHFFHSPLRASVVATWRQIQWIESKTFQIQFTFKQIIMREST